MDQPAADPIALARALGPAIAAAADEIERTRRIPAALLDQLHAARGFRMLLPRSAGGDEVAPWTYAAAVAEYARADASLAWNIFVGNSAALIAPFIAVLPPDVGSNQTGKRNDCSTNPPAPSSTIRLRCSSRRGALATALIGANG